MSEVNKHIYNAEDIHKYFSGKMTTTQMHAMEKAALNDPLLADAMEGYHTLPSITDDKKFGKLQKDLNELKGKLSVKKTDERVYNSLGWKAAAAVLLLFGTVLALYIIKRSNNKEENTIAKISSAPIAKPSLDSTTTVAKADSTATITSNGLASSDNASKDIAANGTVSASGNKMMKEEKVPSVQSQSYSVTQADNNVVVIESPQLAKNAKNKANIFSGRVTDANNNPVAYANLIINDQQQSKTDAKGMFSLSFPDADIQLDVTASNFYPITTKLNANNFTAIKLSAIKHTLKKGNSDTIRSSTVQVLYKLGVEPKEGWEKYIYFLTQQLSNSQYDDGRHVTGEMIVSFEINRLLQPADFKFEKSIDEDVNNTIETFIITGPEWKEASENGGLPGTVRLKIIF